MPFLGDPGPDDGRDGHGDVLEGGHGGRRLGGGWPDGLGDFVEWMMGRMVAGMAIGMLWRGVMPGEGLGDDGGEVSGDVMEMHLFRGRWAGIAGMVMGM